MSQNGRESDLLNAVGNDDVVEVRRLLEAGCSPNESAFGDMGRQSVMSFAAGFCSVDTVKALLEHGGDPNGSHSDEKSPLAMAVRAKNKEAVLALLAAGAVLRFKEGQRVCEALVEAAKSGSGDLCEIIWDGMSKEESERAKECEGILFKKGRYGRF